MKTKAIAMWLVLGATILLVACSSKPISTPKRETLAAEVHATAMANPDASGRPSPVVVFVLSLRSLDRLQAVDMLPLLDSPATALASDLVSFRQITVLPGEVKGMELDVTSDTRFIAAIAALQGFKDQQWKDTVDISGNALKVNKILIDIDQSGIHIPRN